MTDTRTQVFDTYSDRLASLVEDARVSGANLSEFLCLIVDVSGETYQDLAALIVIGNDSPIRYRYGLADLTAALRLLGEKFDHEGKLIPALRRAIAFERARASMTCVVVSHGAMLTTRLKQKEFVPPDKILATQTRNIAGLQLRMIEDAANPEDVIICVVKVETGANLLLRDADRPVSSGAYEMFLASRAQIRTFIGMNEKYRNVFEQIDTPSEGNVQVLVTTGSAAKVFLQPVSSEIICLQCPLELRGKHYAVRVVMTAQCRAALQSHYLASQHTPEKVRINPSLFVQTTELERDLPSDWSPADLSAARRSNIQAGIEATLHDEGIRIVVTHATVEQPPVTVELPFLYWTLFTGL